MHSYGVQKPVGKYKPKQNSHVLELVSAPSHLFLYKNITFELIIHSLCYCHVKDWKTSSPFSGCQETWKSKIGKEREEVKERRGKEERRGKSLDPDQKIEFISVKIFIFKAFNLQKIFLL